MKTIVFIKLLIRDEYSEVGTFTQNNTHLWSWARTFSYWWGLNEIVASSYNFLTRNPSNDNI